MTNLDLGELRKPRCFFSLSMDTIIRNFKTHNLTNYSGKYLDLLYRGRSFPFVEIERMEAYHWYFKIFLTRRAEIRPNWKRGISSVVGLWKFHSLSDRSIFSARDWLQTTFKHPRDINTKCSRPKHLAFQSDSHVLLLYSFSCPEKKNRHAVTGAYQGKGYECKHRSQGEHKYICRHCRGELSRERFILTEPEGAFQNRQHMLHGHEMC